MSLAVAVRPYQNYVYAYPHKTAYRPLNPRPSLQKLWASEPKGALSLYLHIPFCEVRCGFCNLFTRIGAPGEMSTAYLDALERQSRVVAECVGDGTHYDALAFGGGTPTFLDASELDRLCDIAEFRMGADLSSIPFSVEASPSTVTADRMSVLASRGTTRLSLGVQSFIDSEARAAARPQKRADVEAALGRIRDARIPVLNIDLIYGIDGQTEQTFKQSLDAALAWVPEELYLYPLYVRALTGLGRKVDGTDTETEWDEHRLRLYRFGRDYLERSGYRQVSMRMFQRVGAVVEGAADYACQTDGMIGLGCGARSYTADLHYSFDYAVEMREIRGIVDSFIARPANEFAYAEVGRYMTADETRRRHLVQSVLQAEGMDVHDYRARFGSTPEDDFPEELARFASAGWLASDRGSGRLVLSAEGIAYSDAIGPALFSDSVSRDMADYEAK
ncbi:STM4012 family radical SAM protein [Rhodococcus erythropolis]|uniref:STM4012 family radical SAM protein n=1 Tax=Rhodococcus erythropolis TaxID=1833 RepID=UPI00294A0DF9|nr:STM4012 family radical SAM protein [Rhodococcus erythropolis]MDV6276270.1 STM4012 family radical SAM protein [Rhodococcus erythropolis]